MKTILITAILLSAILFVLLSCGVILDDLSKIEGTWKFNSAAFYVYNQELDSIKKYTSSDGTADETHPARRDFFDSTGDTYTITFSTGNKFSILDGEIEVVDSTRTYWNINGFTNSLILSITPKVSTPSDPLISFWEDSKGYTITNYWPLAENNQLEISIMPSDFGLDYFTVNLSNETLQVSSMKGYFSR